MIDSFTLKGHWWLPYRESERYLGDLNFDPDHGAVLGIVGTFQEFSQLGTSFETDFILGQTLTGQKVTLYMCSSMSSVIGALTATANIRARYVLVGHHFTRMDYLKFEKLYVEFDYLKHWVGVTGVKERSYPDKENKLLKHESQYEIPVLPAIAIKDYKLRFAFGYKIEKRYMNGFDLSERISLEIRPLKRLTLEQYLNNICYSLRNFLSLACLKPVRLTSIMGKNRNCRHIIAGKYHYPNIDIYFAQGVKEPARKNLHDADMLFTYKQIQDKMGEYLQNWIANSDKIEAVHDLFFAELYSEGSFSIDNFRRIVTALECLHRETGLGNELPEAKHNDRIQSILGNVPAEHKDWLGKKLLHSNEVNLRKRLEFYFARYKDLFGLTSNKRSRVIYKIVTSRNYFTHFDNSLRNEIFDDAKRFYVTRALQWFIIAAMLEGMGVDKGRSIELIEDTQDFIWAKKLFLENLT